MHIWDFTIQILGAATIEFTKLGYKNSSSIRRFFTDMDSEFLLTCFILPNYIPF